MTVLVNHNARWPIILLWQFVTMGFCKDNVSWQKRYVLAEGWEIAVATKMSLKGLTPVINSKLISPDACRALVHIDKKDIEGTGNITGIGNTDYALLDIKREKNKTSKGKKSQEIIVEMKRYVSQEDIFCAAAARQGLHLLRVNQKWYKRIPPYGIPFGLVDDYFRKWFNIGAPKMQVATETNLKQARFKNSFAQIITFVEKLSCIKNIRPQYYLLSAGVTTVGSGTQFMAFVFNASKIKNWEFTYRAYGIRKGDIKKTFLSANDTLNLPVSEKLAPGTLRRDGFGIALVTVKNENNGIKLIGSHALVAKCHNSRYIMKLIKDADASPKATKALDQAVNEENDDEGLVEDTSKFKSLKTCFHDLVYRLRTWSYSQSHRWKEVAVRSQNLINLDSKYYINYGTSQEFHYFLFQNPEAQSYVLAVVWIDEDFPDSFVLVSNVTTTKENLTPVAFSKREKDKEKKTLEPTKAFIKDSCPGIKHWETRDGKNGRSSTPIERYLKQYALYHFNFKAHWKVLLLRKERKGELRMIFGVHYDYDENKISLPWMQQANVFYFCALVDKKYKSKIKQAQCEGFDAELDIVVALVFQQNEYDAIPEGYKLQIENQKHSNLPKNPVPTPIKFFLNKWNSTMVLRFQSMVQHKMDKRAVFFKLNSPTATVAYAVVLYKMEDSAWKEQENSCILYESMDSLYYNLFVNPTQHHKNTFTSGLQDVGSADTSIHLGDRKSSLSDTNVNLDLSQTPKPDKNQTNSRSLDIRIILDLIKTRDQRKISDTKVPSPAKAGEQDESEQWEALIQLAKYQADVETLRKSYVQYSKDGKLHFYLFEIQETESSPLLYLLWVAYIDNKSVVFLKEATLTLNRILEDSVRRTYFKLFRVSSNIRKRKSIMYREVGRHVLSEDIILKTPADSQKASIIQEIQGFGGIKNKGNISHYAKSDIIFDQKYHFVRLHSYVVPKRSGKTKNPASLPTKPVLSSLNNLAIKSKMSWTVIVQMTGIDLAKNMENNLEDVARNAESGGVTGRKNEAVKPDSLGVIEAETPVENAQRLGTIDNTIAIKPITPELQKNLDKYYTSETFDVKYTVKAWIEEGLEHYSDWNSMNLTHKKTLETCLSEFAANQYQLHFDFEILLIRNIADDSILRRNIFHMVFGYHYPSGQDQEKYKKYFCALLHKKFNEMLEDKEPHDLVIALAIEQTSQDAIAAGYELEMEYILKSSEVVGIAHIAHLQLADKGKDWGIITPIFQNILQYGAQYRVFNFKITTNVGRIGYACAMYNYAKEHGCWVGSAVKIYKSGDNRSDDVQSWMKNEDQSHDSSQEQERSKPSNQDAAENNLPNGEGSSTSPNTARFLKPEPISEPDSDSSSALPEWPTVVDEKGVDFEEVPIALDTQGWTTLTSRVDQEDIHEKLSQCRCVVIPNEDTTKGNRKYLLTKNSNIHTFIIGIVGKTYFFIHKFKELILYYCPHIVGFTKALSSAENYISDYIDWQEATADVLNVFREQEDANLKTMFYAKIMRRCFAIVKTGNRYYLVRQLNGEVEWGFASYCAETLLRFRTSCALYDLSWKSYNTCSPITWVENVQLENQEAHGHATTRSLFARFLTGVSNFVDKHICLRAYKWFANVLDLQERQQMLAVILAAEHQKHVVITDLGVYRDSKPTIRLEEPMLAKNDPTLGIEVDELLENARDKILPVNTEFITNLKQQFVIVNILPFKSLIENTSDPKGNSFQALSVINFLDEDLNFSLGGFRSSIYPRYSLARDQAEHENRLNKC